jgi:hypothetical protein
LRVGPAACQLDTIPAATPAHIVKTLINQKQSTALICFDALRKFAEAHIGGDPFTFVLDLPNHPSWSEDSSHPQAFGGIVSIAMTNSIHKCFLEA